MQIFNSLNRKEDWKNKNDKRAHQQCTSVLKYIKAISVDFNYFLFFIADEY